MLSWLDKNFWNVVARIILRYRILVLTFVVGITILFSTQWKYVSFTFSEANILPNDHPVNLEYKKFLETFGEEGNLMVIGVMDSKLFYPENFKAWNLLNRKLRAMPEISAILSTENISYIEKNKQKKTFENKRLLEKFGDDLEGHLKFEKFLTNNFPFYENMVYSKDKKSFRSLLFLDKEIVNTVVRRDFIINDFKPLIQKFEKQTGIKVHISGMPYIRTSNTSLIMNEIALFVFGAIFVTSFIFFLFFRSFRATFISIIVVAISIMWGVGLMGVLGYKITILTALIPPLVIVIGIPNCIFLISKYQKEVLKHGNKVLSLSRVISKIGNATLMTNITTAVGFGTFTITESFLLKEFGVVASINIIFIFILSLLIIPPLYSFMPTPKDRHLKHLNKAWMKKILKSIERLVRHRRLSIYIVSLVVLIIGIIGAYKINISGSLLDDIPKNKPFAKDIDFFEEEYGGVLPVEITIDTKRKGGATKLSTLRKMDKLQELIKDTPELSNPISVVNLAKYIKQVYYNNNPRYYELPSTQESSFILSYAKKSTADINFLKNLVDSTAQVARITTMMKNIDINRIEAIESNLKRLVEKEFPPKKYEVHITGKALAFTKGTKYLVNNLFLSLLFAIGLISLMMVYLFRSFRMIVISLIPNLLPLIVTAGMMGFLGIPLKPSTILVFSVAFGISVDDTLHFLAKYRQELKSNDWKIARSVYAALRETGLSMFYTSVILFFGFSVFTLSSFGGTIALGSLVSVTLFVAMASNLLLLPSLLISLEKRVTNKKHLKKSIELIISSDDDEK